MNDLPEGLEMIARAIRDRILADLHVAVLSEKQATAMATILEESAQGLRCLMRHALPAAARHHDALPDGVADLDAIRRRRRRLRLVSDGGAA